MAPVMPPTSPSSRPVRIPVSPVGSPLLPPPPPPPLGLLACDIWIAFWPTFDVLSWGYGWAFFCPCCQPWLKHLSPLSGADGLDGTPEVGFVHTVIQVLSTTPSGEKPVAARRDMPMPTATAAVAMGMMLAKCNFIVFFFLFLVSRFKRPDRGNRKQANSNTDARGQETAVVLAAVIWPSAVCLKFCTSSAVDAAALNAGR